MSNKKLWSELFSWLWYSFSSLWQVVRAKERIELELDKQIGPDPEPETPHENADSDSSSKPSWYVIHLCCTSYVIYISLSYSHVDQTPILSMAVGWGYYKSPKSFLDENKCMYRDGTLKNQPNKMGNTFTPSLHLVVFCHGTMLCVCLFFILLFVCIGGLWKAVGLVYSAAWACSACWFYISLWDQDPYRPAMETACTYPMAAYKVTAAAGGWPAWK